MEKRKNPEKDLKNKSSLFFQIGLLMAMGLVVSAFELKTEREASIIDRISDPFETPPIVPITIVKPPPPPPPKPILANPVEATEQPIEELPPLVTFEPQPLVDIPEPEVIEPPKEEVKEFWDYVEEAPEPVGGYQAFYKFLSKNVKYPRRARNLGISGKVYIQFIVDPDGNITQIQTIKGVGAGLDEEAIRVLGQAPVWKPGRQGGRRVSVRMVIPINFEMPR